MTRSIDALVTDAKKLMQDWVDAGAAEGVSLPATDKGQACLALMPGIIEFLLPSSPSASGRRLRIEPENPLIVRYCADSRREFPTETQLPADMVQELRTTRAERLNQEYIEARKAHACISLELASAVSRRVEELGRSYAKLTPSMREAEVLPAERRVLLSLFNNARSLMENGRTENSLYLDELQRLRSFAVKAAMAATAIEAGLRWHRDRTMGVEERKLCQVCESADNSALVFYESVVRHASTGVRKISEVYTYRFGKEPVFR